MQDRPTPDDPGPAAPCSPAEAQLALEEPAVLDFLRGEYTAARGSAPTVPPGPAPLRPAQPEPTDREPTSQDRLVYLPAASHCYAIVLNDTASARLVRRLVGLFGDVTCAEDYARQCGYHLYDVVPATAVIPRDAITADPSSTKPAPGRRHLSALAPSTGPG